MCVEFIERAWNAYKRNFWQIVCAIILIYGILIGLAIVCFMPLFGAILLSINIGVGNVQNILIQAITNPLVLFLTSLGLLVICIAGAELGAGLTKLYADALKGRVNIEAMFFIIKKKFWTILLANFLRGLIIIGVFALLLSPYLIFLLTKSYYISAFFLIVGVASAFLLSLLFSLVNQAVVIDNFNAIESIKKSVEIIKSNYLQFLVLFSILMVLSLITSFLEWVGMLINLFLITPITMLSFTSFYLEKRKKPLKRRLKKKSVKRKKR